MQNQASKKWGAALAALAVLALAYWAYGGLAVAGVVGAFVMWLMLSLSRLLRTMERAAMHPLGQVDSAAALAAHLGKGMALLKVLALTRSLGEPLSEVGGTLEVFRWTDAQGGAVTCEFANGKLQKWRLLHPLTEGANAAP